VKSKPKRSSDKKSIEKMRTLSQKENGPAAGRALQPNKKVAQGEKKEHTKAEGGRRQPPRAPYKKKSSPKGKNPRNQESTDVAKGLKNTCRGGASRKSRKSERHPLKQCAIKKKKRRDLRGQRPKQTRPVWKDIPEVKPTEGKNRSDKKGKKEKGR